MGVRGTDIVCAGVSALTQACALALTRHAAIPVVVSAEDGALCCDIATAATEQDRGRADDILSPMVVGVREIAFQYPQAVRVEDEGAGPKADPFPAEG